MALKSFQKIHFRKIHFRKIHFWKYTSGNSLTEKKLSDDTLWENTLSENTLWFHIPIDIEKAEKKVFWNQWRTWNTKTCGRSFDHILGAISITLLSGAQLCENLIVSRVVKGNLNSTEHHSHICWFFQSWISRLSTPDARDAIASINGFEKIR